jgi:hypothetical protein
MTIEKDETELREEDIRQEHQRAINPSAHWAYLVGVLGGGLVLMLALIAFLGRAA